jgi:hypothetical protein
LQPQILKRFCGNATSPNTLFADILNKYQIETFNPFAERIDYRLLDQSKFVNPIPKGFSASSFKDLPLLAEEFRQLIKNDNVSIFKQQFDAHGDRGQYRKYIKTVLQKFVIRRIREYIATNNIAYCNSFSKESYISYLVKLYIDSGKPKPKACSIIS